MNTGKTPMHKSARAIVRDISMSALRRSGISAHTLERKSWPNTPAHSDSASGSGTILLVSRDIHTRGLIRSVLFNRGYLVLDAANEHQAAAVCVMIERDIDLIIVDASAIDSPSWGKWHQCTPNLLILHDQAGPPPETEDVHTAVEYMTKPVTAEQITATVQSMLSSRKKRKKILLVEDDESLRRMLAAILEASGFEIAQASNGREALNRPDVLQMDAILTEIVTPEVESVEMIQALLKLKPNLTIVALSGVERAEQYFSLAKRLGAKARLTKPIDVRELLDILDDLWQQ